MSPVRSVTYVSGRTYLSAISLIETIYLVERGRLHMEALRRLEASAANTARSGLLIQSVDEAIASAVGQIPGAVVSDMPDRIIAATALHLGIPLVTRDQRIQSLGIKTIW